MLEFTILFPEIPTQSLTDITGCIFFTIALLMTDVLLRIIIECNNYLRATRKRKTALNYILTVIWFGWGEAGKEKRRFLVSKGLRNALTLKMTVQYPALFLFSALSFLLPDIVIAGWRFDLLISFVFSIIPIVCEVTSIIEKLNMLDAEIIHIWNKVTRLVRIWK
jgi:hypothetical protein